VSAYKTYTSIRAFAFKPQAGFTRQDESPKKPHAKTRKAGNGVSLSIKGASPWGREITWSELDLLRKVPPREATAEDRNQKTESTFCNRCRARLAAWDQSSRLRLVHGPIETVGSLVDYLNQLCHRFAHDSNLARQVWFGLT
jgi:hypothetical protein